ncbi:MAG: GTPase RsgA, partial [Vicinamibacterales bacterium]
MLFDLRELGWDEAWATAFAAFEADGLVPARVAIEFNHIFRLYAAAGELQAQHAGRLLHHAAGREHLAAVGDWVAARPGQGDASATIEAILPRRTKFSRKVAGEVTEEQVVAANIDTVFLVMGLDGDYNPRRIERYLLMAYESGASPVVLLTKADIADDVPGAVVEIERAAIGTPVHALSAREGTGLEVLDTYLQPGKTGTLLGSSGSGKSTLINA